MVDTTRTLGDLAFLDLKAVTAAATAGASVDQHAIREIIAPCAWVGRSVDLPLLPSGFSHGYPWSVSTKGLLFEPQSEGDRTARSYFDVGMEVARRIERALPNASLSRLRAIEDLFRPTWEGAPFRIWFAVNNERAKVYLCPSARRADRVDETIREAFDRLGLSPPPLSTPTILSLDLESRDDARVKLYALTTNTPPLDDEARSLLEHLGITPRRWLVSQFSDVRTIHIPTHDGREIDREGLGKWVRDRNLPSIGALPPDHRHHFIALRTTPTLDLTVHYARTLNLLDPGLFASKRLDAALHFARQKRVFWHPARGPFWAITRHDDAMTVLRDEEHFTSALGTHPGKQRRGPSPLGLNNLDGAAHSEARARLDLGDEHLAIEAAEAVLDQKLGSSDTIDVAGDLAPAVARAAIFTWLRIPFQPKITSLIHASHRAGALVLATPTSDPRFRRRSDRALRIKKALYEAVPAPLPLLLEAGLPTIADAIASGVATLLGQPALLEIDAEAHARTITNELLRIASPILCFARWCTSDVEVGAQLIKAGDQAVVFFASANRDERVFPEQINLLRDPNPHLAFGFGPHACIGARLARGVLEMAWRRLVPFLRARQPWSTAHFKRRRTTYLLGFDSFVIASQAKTSGS